MLGPLLLLLAAQGAAVTHGPLTLTTPIVHASPDAGEAVAAYLAISNKGAADRLVKVECACAERGEVHFINRSGAEVSMDTLPALDVPANGRVEIRPGSPLHLMLLPLKTPLAAGGTVDLTLTFEKAGAVTVPFRIVDDTRAAWVNHPAH